MIVLGIHGGVMPTQHDAGAAVVVNGRLAAVCEEERFARYKGAFGHLPLRSIQACLEQANIRMTDIGLLVSSGNTHRDLRARIQRYFQHYFGHVPPLLMIEHQMAHLASAYYSSGFDEAMVISIDAYGDQASGALAIGNNGALTVHQRLPQFESLGLFYAAITSYLGFLVSEDEYKVMGLSAYGQPGMDLSPIVRLGDNGLIQMDTRYWQDPLRPVSRFERYFSPALESLLGPPRQPDEEITQRHCNIARAAQTLLEKAVTSLVRTFHAKTSLRRVALAGGVALNCLANWRILQLPEIDDLFVQPAASDRGIALGCALYGAASNGDPIEALDHVQYGRSYDEKMIESALRTSGYRFERCDNTAEAAAEALDNGRIIGWFQGRSEFGPRALGGRSILADPRNRSMKEQVNRAVKYREKFRPFAPAVLLEDLGEIFECSRASPFMTVTYPVRPTWRPKIPAVTHADGTARVQSVSASTSPLFHSLLKAFKNRTNIPVLLNTSFNVRGEPIVETPADALATFARSALSELFIGPFRVSKFTPVP